MTKEEGFQVMLAASEKELAGALARLMTESRIDRRILASQAHFAFRAVLAHKQQGDHHAVTTHCPDSRLSDSPSSLC